VTSQASSFNRTQCNFEMNPKEGPFEFLGKKSYDENGSIVASD